jgi:hypothetical protein
MREREREIERKGDLERDRQGDFEREGERERDIEWWL